MQDPFRNLSNLEANANRAANQVRNPGGQARAKADMINRQINQGTANLISALCYITGFMILFAATKKEWKTDPQIRFHRAHAKVLWFAIIICSCTVVGLVLAVPLYMLGFYMGFQAISGLRAPVPFLTQFLYTRQMI